MGYEKLEMHSVKCDFPGCRESKSVGGSAETLWDEGWTHEVYFGDFYRTLCQTHTDFILEKLSITKDQFEGTEPDKRVF